MPAHKTEAQERELMGLKPRLRGRQNAPSMANIKTFQPTNPDFIKVRRTESKGWGTFAARDIPAGHRIISEVPLFQVHKDHVTADYIEAALASIHEAKRAEFGKLDFISVTQGLEGYEKQAESVCQILLQNAMEVPDHNGGRYVVAVEAAKINHSCIPNCIGNMNPLTNCYNVQITEEIKRNQEILICYVDPLLSSSDRQKALKRYHEFICNCEICDTERISLGHVEQSNRRHEEIRDIYQEIRDFQPLGNGYHIETSEYYEENLISQINRLIDLCEDEQLWPPLALAVRNAAESCLRTGNKELAVQWKKEEKKLIHKTIGLDTPEGNDITHWFMRHRIDGEYLLWCPVQEDRNQILTRNWHLRPRRGTWEFLVPLPIEHAKVEEDFARVSTLMNQGFYHNRTG